MFYEKNGFTLVELLAVIAILAILVIIAMPNVIDMFNNAKIDVFVNDVQKIMDTAKGEFTVDAFSNAGQTIYYSSVDNDILNTSPLDMETNGKEYFIEMDRHGEFKRVVVYDTDFCYDIYTNGTAGDVSSTNSKLIAEMIKKSLVVAEDVNLSSNDEINVDFNGSNYVVKGCNVGSVIEDIGYINFI